MTKDNQTVSWDDIKNYHVNVLGWDDIGYHFGIELIENDYQILYGRSLLKSGAHTRGKNKDSIGICCIGNYDNQEPQPALYDKLNFLVNDLSHIFNIPAQNIDGHRSFSEKTCPGKYFNLSKIKNELLLYT